MALFPGNLQVKDWSQHKILKSSLINVLGHSQVLLRINEKNI